MTTTTFSRKYLIFFVLLGSVTFGAAFLRYYVVKKPFGISAFGYSLYKKALATGWMAKKQLYYDDYLAQLVSVYSNPFFSEEEKFTTHERQEREQRDTVVLQRFDNDIKSIIVSMLHHFSCLRLTSLGKWEVVPNVLDEKLAQRYQGDKNKINGIKSVLSTLLSYQETNKSFDGHIRDYLKDWSIIPAQQIGTQLQAQSQHDIFEKDRMLLLGIILDQIIKPELIPHFYDYDYIDDLENIVESEYTLLHEAGSTRGQVFMRALTMLVDFGSSNHEQTLVQKLKNYLGKDHLYVPKRTQHDAFLKKSKPHIHDALVGIKAEDNLQKFLAINKEYSGEQLARQGKTDSRQISLLRGYEQNNHLLLRTLIGLIRDGKISKNDEVLIIGPRYVDEIVFFRKHLGLTKTIGLDLCKNENVVEGDMHAMPFEKGRFKLVYMCNTLCYSYNARKVIDEISRVLVRPGYAFIIDHGTYYAGAGVIGRSDVMNAEALVGLFYKNSINVLAQDNGKSLVRYASKNQSSCAVELKG